MRLRSAVLIVMENISLNGSMILKWIINKEDIMVRAGFS
jgi:hypothetical protein